MTRPKNACVPRLVMATILMTVVASQVSAEQPIVLTPTFEKNGKARMGCRANVPELKNGLFALGIPENISCKAGRLVNHVDVREDRATITWQQPDAKGVVAGTGSLPEVIFYTTRLTPFVDHVDIEMTINNLTDTLWENVTAFDCLNPGGANMFKDWKLERTYMSVSGGPLRMDGAERTVPEPPRQQTLQFFLHEQVPAGEESAWLSGFQATSPKRTDGNWIVTLSDPPGAYMAAATADSVYLFDNMDRCCIHSLPTFGDIGPGESSSTTIRFYFAKGELDDFLARYEKELPELIERQDWARPTDD